MPVLNDIKAQLKSTDSDYGKFIIDMVGYGGSTDFFVGIDGPGGLVVKAYPGSSDGTGATLQLKVSIPTDSSGSLIQGDYDFRIRKEGTSTVDESKTFCLSFTKRTMSVTAVADCYSKTLVVTDASTYPAGTVTRSIVVSTPVIAGEDDVADITYTDAETLIDMVRSSGNAYSNVTYGISATTEILTAEIEDDWQFGYELDYTAYSTETLVRCDTDGCGIIGCVNDAIQSLISKASKVGGFSKLPVGESAKLQELQMYLVMYNYYNQCKNNTQALYYYDKLKTLTADCDCTSDSGPVVISDSSYVYLRGYSAYELWLQDGNTGTLNDFFSALYPITDWTAVDDAVFINNYEQDSSIPLMYRMTKTHIEFKGAFDSVIGATSSTNPEALLSASFDPVDVIGNSYAFIRNGSEFAGWFYKNTTDGKWYMNWNSNFNRTDQQFITGQIAIDGYLTSAIQLNALGFTEIPSAQYEAGYSQYIANPLYFKTDGNFIVFKGEFTATVWLSPGANLIDPTYWTSQGVSLEEGTIIGIYQSSDKTLAGHAKVVNGTLRVYPITPSPSTGIQVYFDGIIPLA
jgi:hypothetical protein